MNNTKKISFNKGFFFITFLLLLIFVLAITLMNQRQSQVTPLLFMFVLTGILSYLVFFNSFVIGEKNFTFLLVSILYIPIILSFINYIYRSGNPSFNDVLYSIYPLLLYQIMYSFLKQKASMIDFVLILLFAIAIFACFKIFQNRGILFDQHNRFVQTNWSNILGATLPFLFLIKRKTIQTISWIVFGIFIVLGLKRMSMIAFVLVSLILLGFRSRKDLININYRKLLIVSIIIFIALSFSIFPKIDIKAIDVATKRIENISSDGGSNRDIIFQSGLAYWFDDYKTPFPNKILGFGYRAYNVEVDSNVESAHNDVIDFLLNFGVFAAIILLVFYFRLIFLVYWFWKMRSVYFPFVLSTVLIFFIYSNLAALLFYFFFFSQLIIGIAYIEVLKKQLEKRKSYVHVSHIT